MTTKSICRLEEKNQKKLREELTLFFPKIFQRKKDWEYMVRHFFYEPEDNTLRQTVFVRNEVKKLIAVCAFDTGIFSLDNQPIHLIYIHIRAVLPEFRKDGIGRTLSEKIIKTLEPDMLLTTCVQISSLYSWLHISDPLITKNYLFFPHIEQEQERKKTIPIPFEDLDFTLRCFRKIYKSHVKENKKRLDDVVKTITANMVRKGENTFFGHLKWHEHNVKATIADDLGITENDALLLVIKKSVRT